MALNSVTPSATTQFVSVDILSHALFRYALCLNFSDDQQSVFIYSGNKFGECLLSYVSGSFVFSSAV
jgi:hypothetical protein